MDVYFDIQRGRTFCIEIGYFDSVLEIKEKVHKYQGIPVAKQTLFFNGHVLQDDGDVWKCEILNNSHIQLVVAPDSDKSHVAAGIHKTEEVSPAMGDLSTTVVKIHLNLKIASFKAHVPIEMNVNDTVLKLKEKIQEMEGVPTSKIVLHATGTELHDHQLLKDCEISDKYEIDVSLRPSPTTSGVASGGGGGGGSKKLKLMVLPNTGTNKIPVEVNASDNVRELRKELQKLHQKLQFHLPQEGYFFIYKQNVMDDDMSFRWHHVVQGDTIEIFNGSVTGGS